MKILFIDFSIPYLLKDSEYPVGGWAVQLKAWLTGLVANGDNVAILSWKGSKEYVGEENAFEIIDTYDPQQGIKYLKYFYSYIPCLLAAAKRYRPDVIIQACSGINTGIMAFIANQIKVPFVYRVANDMDVDARNKSRLKKYEQIAFQYGLKKADVILCQNTYQFDRMNGKFPQKRIYIIHNPFDTNQVVKEINPRAKRNYIAWLGVFSKQKNMPLLYMMAKQLPDIKFKIAGAPSDELDEESKISISQLEKLPNVAFVGYVKRENVLHFLSSSIALLSTSHYEGFSNTFLESFATGTPVIAPRRIDPDSIISKNGIGMTSETDEELFFLIPEMVGKTTTEYGKLAVKCQNYLIDNHTPKAKVKEFMTIMSASTHG